MSLHVQSLHSQLTSAQKAVSGMSAQCLWNHFPHVSQATHSSSSPSGSLQVQYSSIFCDVLMPSFLRLLVSIGKRWKLMSSRHVAKCDRMFFWSYLTFPGSNPAQKSCVMAIARTPQSEPLHCFSTSTICIVSISSEVTVRFAMMGMIDTEKKVSGNTDELQVSTSLQMRLDILWKMQQRKCLYRNRKVGGAYRSLLHQL